MKKFIVCFLLAFIVLGCVNKDKPKELVDNKLEYQEELRGDDGNYRNFELHNLEISNNEISLHYVFDASPSNLTYSIHLLQNGVPIPFTFEKDGKYESTQFKKFSNEKNEGKVYLQPNSFKKGEKINFGMTFHNNPDYIPKIQEFTRYSFDKQFPSGLSYVLDTKKDYESSSSVLLENINWKKTGIKENPNFGEYYYENDSAEVLIGLIEGKAVNDANVMHLKKGKDLTINVLQKSREESSGIISFYVDHQLMKIEGKYDSAKLQYSDEGYGITTLHLEVPDNLKKGNYTFYASIVDIPSINDKYNIIHFTPQRVLILE